MLILHTDLFPSLCSSRFLNILQKYFTFRIYFVFHLHIYMCPYGLWWSCVSLLDCFWIMDHLRINSTATFLQSLNPTHNQTHHRHKSHAYYVIQWYTQKGQIPEDFYWSYYQKHMYNRCVYGRVPPTIVDVAAAWPIMVPMHLLQFALLILSFRFKLK